MRTALYARHYNTRYVEAYLSCFRRCPETPLGRERGRGICARNQRIGIHVLRCQIIIILASTIRGQMKRLSSFGFLPSSQAAEAESQDRGKRANSWTIYERTGWRAFSFCEFVFASGSYRRLCMRDRSRGRG